MARRKRKRTPGGSKGESRGTPHDALAKQTLSDLSRPRSMPPLIG